KTQRIGPRDQSVRRMARYMSIGRTQSDRVLTAARLAAEDNRVRQASHAPDTSRLSTRIRAGCGLAGDSAQHSRTSLTTTHRGSVARCGRIVTSQKAPRTAQPWRRWITDDSAPPDAVTKRPRTRRREGLRTTEAKRRELRDRLETD